MTSIRLTGRSRLLRGAILLLILPVGCIDNPATTQPPDPFVSEYQLLWELFDTEYVGFQVKGIDWGQVRAEYADAAADVSSMEEMIGLAQSMLAELEDRHVELIGPEGDTLPSWDPGYFVNADPAVLMGYLEPCGFVWMQPEVWGFCLAGPDSIPYFLVTEWDGSFNTSLLDNVLEPLLDSPGLILDVRLCEEGTEGAVDNVVRRFVDQVRIGHLLQERTDPGTHDLSDPTPCLLHPRSWGFDAPVALLTGEANSGAGEVFACDMAELPQVALIGDTTRGSGDWPAVAWGLPEGWTVTCPERTVLRPDSSYIEGDGVPPDIVVESASADFENGFDPVLEYAFAWLGAQPPEPGPDRGAAQSSEVSTRTY